ncbi:hypothetical protein [Halocatena halophila]|uniref:hypothetical protein n=1 Tax=Halocatena halophila TaxID=2814576 RepID=UPI002ED690D5
MSSDIDYATLPIPDDKLPTEYTYGERRSELYDLIEEAGHPRNLERSQKELGQRYGVSQRQISKDIERLREYEAERVGRDADATTNFVLQRAVRGLLEDESWRDAAQTQLDYYNWLFEIGEKEKEPDKQEVSGPEGDPIAVEHTGELSDTDREFLDSMFEYDR